MKLHLSDLPVCGRSSGSWHVACRVGHVEEMVSGAQDAQPLRVQFQMSSRPRYWTVNVYYLQTTQCIVQ